MEDYELLKEALMKKLKSAYGKGKKYMKSAYKTTSGQEYKSHMAKKPKIFGKKKHAAKAKQLKAKMRKYRAGAIGGAAGGAGAAVGTMYGASKRDK